MLTALLAGIQIEWVAYAMNILFMVLGLGIYLLAKKIFEKKIDEWDSFKKNLPSIPEVKGEIEALLDSSREVIGADNLTLLYANNGGVILAKIGPIYTSVHTESCDDKESKKKLEEDWSHVPMSTSYITQLLVPIIEEGEALISTENLEDPDLKAYYNSIGRKCALLLPIGFYMGKFWYASAKWADLIGVPEIASIEMKFLVEKLKTVLEEMKDFP